MANTALFAEIAALAGDPSRASMLHALMDGRALTATELARLAGIAPQTASGHLGRLVSCGLVNVVQQGRHRYHRLASPDVARMIEAIMQTAMSLAPPRGHLSIGPREVTLRLARTCYDHLAGRLGVSIADGLIASGYAEFAADAGVITERGMRFLAKIGLATDTFVTEGGKPSRRALCRPCMDWSERRAHLAGAVGAALCRHSLDRGWVRRLPGSRALTITRAGQRFFGDHFGFTA